MTPFSFAISDIVVKEKPSKHVFFKGELDESNVDHHAETMYELIKLMPRGSYIVIDGSHLSYLNSKALGYLTDWYNKLSQKDGKIVCIHLKPEIFDILDVVGITQIIAVYPTLQDV